MKAYPRLSFEQNVERASECFYQYVRGKDDLFFPHSHEFYEIFLTVSGVVHHWLNGVQQELPEGSLVFIRPNDTHGYLYDDKKSRDTEYINLTFSNEVANSLFEYLSPDFPINELLNAAAAPCVLLNPTAKKRLLSELSELNTLNWENKSGLKLRMKTLLADIFVQYFYSFKETSQPKMPHWLSQLLNEMNNYDNFVAGSERMIELSKKSREHLSRVVKKHLNMSLTEYINSLRINYAANLLLTTNVSILDVCSMSGFQNLGYFYKVFKSFYSVSPAQFVARYKSKPTSN